jgi:hypothetical protein
MRDYRVQAVGVSSIAAVFAAGIAAGARRRRRAVERCVPLVCEAAVPDSAAPPGELDDGWAPGPLLSEPFWFDEPPPVAAREREPAVAAEIDEATTDGWGWTAMWAAEEEAERLRAEARLRRDRRPRRERRGSRSRGRRRLPGRSFALVLVFAVGGAGAALAIPHRPAAIAAPASAAAAVAGSPAPSAYALRVIPGAYLELYRRAGLAYGLDWTVLAAVGQIESDHGRSVEPGVTSGTNAAGAAGPAQFLRSTWERFGVNADGRGTISPYDPADATTAMAAYLKASGAPQEWTRALYAYNHSSAYVEEVLALSRRFVAPRERTIS